MGILSLFKKQQPKETAKKESPTVSVDAKQETPAGDAAIFSDTSAIIVRPIITEKAALLQTKGTYVFHAAVNASKQDVRRAIEKRYNVHVTRVHMVNMPTKTRRRGLIEGSVASFRKAMVTLRDGEQLDLTRESR